MNNKRRSEIRTVEKEIVNSKRKLEDMVKSNNYDKATLETIESDLSGMDGILSSLSYEEQDSFDMLPEGLQCSMRGEKMEENVSLLDDASCDIENFMDSIEDCESMKRAEIIEIVSEGIETLSGVIDKLEEACEKH